MKWHFGLKLALIMSLLVLVASCLLGYTMVYRQFSLMESQFNETGGTLASQLSAASVELVFTEDELSLGSLAFSLNNQPSVVAAAILNKDGEYMAEAGINVPQGTNVDAFENSGSLVAPNDVVWFYEPVVFRGVSGGAAWVALDKSELIASQNAVIRSGFIVVGVLVLTISLFAIRLGQSLAKPVRDLIEGTQAIEAGHFGFRIRGNHRGEFSDLTKAFNHMAKGLEQKQRVEGLFSRFVSDPVAARYMAQDNVELKQEGSRVDASVLFVDLVGYTSFSEGRHPEEVAEVLNLYFTEFANTCHHYGGTVDKYIGDCAMLLFGCPQPDPQHRFHAMQCALNIRDRIQRLNQDRMKRGEPCLEIRIGVSGGTVLAGLLGSHERMQYTVIGEAANLASRLCDLADPGHIITDRAFYSRLNEEHPLQAHLTQSINVKGFQAAVDTLTIDRWLPAQSALTNDNEKTDT